MDFHNEVLLWSLSGYFSLRNQETMLSLLPFLVIFFYLSLTSFVLSPPPPTRSLISTSVKLKRERAKEAVTMTKCEDLSSETTLSFTRNLSQLKVGNCSFSRQKENPPFFLTKWHLSHRKTLFLVSCMILPLFYKPSVLKQRWQKPHHIMFLRAEFCTWAFDLLDSCGVTHNQTMLWHFPMCGWWMAC